MEALLRTLLGVGAESLTVGQMLLRVLIVYGTTLLLVRLGEKRFFGERTAFDLVLSIILGSVISRAVNGSAPFFPTLVASGALVGAHWLLAALAFHYDDFGTWVKGQARLLIRNGEVNWEAMRESHLSEQDLRSALRVQGQVDSFDKVKAARLERSGAISVIKRTDEVTVVESTVENGVKVIRIEIRS
jgi:uncharacterized membrane protein YcaP (DUF421 family)